MGLLEYNKRCAEFLGYKLHFIDEEKTKENPTKTYWDTYDDETPSAITVWGEVKSELEALK